MAAMIAAAVCFYKWLTGSGILLEGTWISGGQMLKISDDTAELYRDGTAETAVICITDVQDDLLMQGEIIYSIEADFPHRAAEIRVRYINRSGSVMIDVESGGESETFLRE